MPNNKTQEHAAIEKPGLKSLSKPGRKPLTSEPKNKRTAQNRAAQRAFRERKEKRMKELEDKVLALEREKNQMSNESDFLRVQVRALMKQLNKNGLVPNISEDDKDNNKSNYDFSGNNNNNSSSSNSNNNTNANIDGLRTESIIRRNSNNSLSEPSTSGSINYSSNSSVSSTTPNSLITDEKDFTPNSKLKDVSSLDNNLQLNKNNVENPGNSKYLNDSTYFCKQLNRACHRPINGCVATDNNSPCSSNFNPQSKSISVESMGLDYSNISDSGNGNGNNNNNNLHEFNEGKLLVQRNESDINTGNNPLFIFDSPSDVLNQDHNNEMDFLFANDGIINDTNMLIQSNPDAFKLEDDILNTDFGIVENENENENEDENQRQNQNQSGGKSKNIDGSEKCNLNTNGNQNNTTMTNNINNSLDSNFGFKIDDELNVSEDGEVDIFESLLKMPSSQENKVLQDFNDIPNDDLNNVIEKSSIDNNEDEVVPDNTTNLMKCSQIWERITTHPRFTDLDIDNLCDELKQKAKCSESGVVVDGEDVGKLLKKAIEKNQQKQKNQEMELKIKRAAIGSGNENNIFLGGMW